MRWRYHVILLSVLLGSSGCALLYPIYFDVEPSGLDVATLSIYPSQVDPESPPAYQRIDLSGTGLATLHWGRSHRVNNPFWDKQDDPYWSDLHEATRLLTKEKTEAHFQAFVDAGVFSRFKMRRRHADATHFVNVSIKIDGRPALGATTDPAVLACFDRLRAEFNDP